MLKPGLERALSLAKGERRPGNSIYNNDQALSEGVPKLPVLYRVEGVKSENQSHAKES
jgi:hypothetical protein